MSSIDSTMPIQGFSPMPASGRIQTSRQRYETASVEHAARSASSASVALPALQAPDIKLDASSLGPMLLAIKTKLTNEQIESSREDIKANMQRQTAEHEKALKQIEKAIKAMEKARAEQAKAKKAGEWGKIFGWVAVAASIVAGVAMIATGAGAVAGVIMIGLAIDQAVALGTGKEGLMGQGMGLLEKGLEKGIEAAGKFLEEHNRLINMFLQTNGLPPVEIHGLSEDKAKELAIGLSIAIMVGSLVLATVGSSFLIEESAPELVESMSARFGSAAGVLSKVAAGVGAVGEAGQGGANIARGMDGKEAAGYQKEADEANARKLEFQKFLTKLQAEQSDEQDRLRRVIQQMNETTSRVLDMMGSQQTTTEQIARNLMA